MAYISGQYRFQVKNNININLLIKYKMEMVTEEEEICASLCEEEDLIFKDWKVAISWNVLPTIS